METDMNENCDKQWWHKFVKSSDLTDYKQGPKLILLFAILRQCELIGDKVLVFSQSIPSLDMIEVFLKKADEFPQILCENIFPAEDIPKYVGTWKKGEDYFRMDGSTRNEVRAASCRLFNKLDNPRYIFLENCIFEHRTSVLNTCRR